MKYSAPKKFGHFNLQSTFGVGTFPGCSSN